MQSLSRFNNTKSGLKIIHLEIPENVPGHIALFWSQNIIS
jgi:hypothetical protein